MATEAAGTRFRTDLDGSRGFTFSGLPLRPSLEVGLRHDGGDAETGSGIDIGGGLVVSNPLLGLSADVRARMLLVHQAEGFRDRGVSMAFSFDPAPETPLGFLAKVTPSWGGQAESGAEALWGWDTMTGLANGSIAAGGRLAADLSYGLPVGSRFVDTPRIGIGTSGTGRDYRFGYSLGLLGREGLGFELGLDAHRREQANLNGTDHALVGRFTRRIYALNRCMARRPYKPTHQVKARMIPIRVSDEDSEWLQQASARFSVPISQLMREGARLYIRQLERKGEPGKENLGSQKT